MRPPTTFVRTRLCTVCTQRVLPRVRPLIHNQRVVAHTRRLATTQQQTILEKGTTSTTTPPSASPYTASQTSFSALASTVTARLLTTDKPPPESEVLAAFAAFKAFACDRLQSTPSAPTDTPASALLSLNSATHTQKANASSPPLAQKGQFDDLSELAYRVLSHPSVFLTMAVLAAFVSLQRLTRDATPIPAVFALYANKPIQPASGSGKPRNPNPKQAKYAIPASVALGGLETAIDAGDITAALDVIDTSYGTPAFRRNKIIRRALPFITVAAVAPGAIYVLADKLAGLQDTVDHALAVRYAFGGLLAYSGLTAGIGLLAVGTANDQMVRVTWVPGTPLRERWVREEERAALDAVAMAWGFQETHKRGFEVGEEWELLREVCGRKGMMLDEPSLMEGME